MAALLATIRPDNTQMLRYSRAVSNGYIQVALKSIPITDLLWAKEELFGSEWATPIEEEIAFREFQETGVLPPVLKRKEDEILGVLNRHCGTPELPVEDLPRIPAIFTSDTTYDVVLGRKWTPSKIAETIVQRGYTELMEWVHEVGYEYFHKNCSYIAFSWLAASVGDLNMLKWLQLKGYPMDEWVCKQAAYGGHLDVLKWARANGIQWDHIVYTEAIYNKHMHILEWAYENECPIGPSVCSRAVECGQLDTLKWLHQRGFPLDATCFRVAKILKDREHILQWLEENGCPTTD